MSYFDLTYEGFEGEQWGVSIPPIRPGETEWWDVWAFSRCETYTGPVPILGEEYEGPERRTAFTWCSFNAFVVSQAMGKVMQSVAPESIQLVPLVIDDEPSGQWFILNVLDQVACIDHKPSKVEWGVRDGKEKIISVYYLEIDEQKAAGHHIFRLEEFPVQVLVSQEMADAMNQSGLDGFHLAPLPWSVFGPF